MKYRDAEKILKIFEKNAETTEVIPRWEMAKRVNSLRNLMKPVEKAKEIPTDIVKYNTEQEAIFSKYGTPIQSQGGRGYRIDDWTVVNEELFALKEKYKDALDGEEKRRRDIELLLDHEIDEDFIIEPIDYEWCGKELNGVEIADLIEFGVINPPKKEDNIKNIKDRNKKKK